MTAKSIVRKFSIVVLVVGASLVAGATVAGAGDTGQGVFRIPGTDYDVVLGEAARPPNELLVQPLLGAIAGWLAQEFDLPAIEHYPSVAIVSSEALVGLRYKRLSPPAGREVAGPEMASPQTNDTVAIYSDDSQTIYLAEGWSGRTAADLSVLVHEMVHHVQNVFGLKHECPQQREKLAYGAQERWLALFGHSLETDFELDGLSLLGKTGCF
jgi:hypothetical protein